MDIELAKEIMACLPEGRTRFYYFKDRYALLLLRQACKEQQSIRALRQGQYARLLDKAAVGEVIRRSGNGRLTPEQLVNYWPAQFHCYRLSLGLWGSDRKSRYYQTSRTGYNLVLQMNFSNQHDLCYRRYKIADDEGCFDSYEHPTSDTRNTMAWSRIDLDLETDTALIEEVQTDWLRFAREAYDDAQNIRKAKSKVDREKQERYWFYDFTPEQATEYFEIAVREHLAIWDEAVLSATLEFLLHEIGIRKVYFHSWETGRRVKHCAPPRSVYRNLPRRFCFQSVSEGPGFLIEDKSSRRKMKKIDRQSWYLLDFSGVSGGAGINRDCQLLTA
ncbi:hypothetical protein AWR36_002185 [Microbulbifer flavimaris]|uniref:Uncharacterized protein n=1 Tax=Microbulbifer flavimaris TaxID=1781068 RepID=A0ABX4I2E4_9GAMM|nr:MULTISPECIES: hypothetical protein [Microbulbifer]KUJ84505.1 hypothetical protein AVO43_02190 [Microbulbifer sp. ZGT114]PCO06592.1 hypothetical protein AWR36_002185 [Microbulbifer flavimaris]